MNSSGILLGAAAAFLLTVIGSPGCSPASSGLHGEAIASEPAAPALPPPSPPVIPAPAAEPAPVPEQPAPAPAQPEPPPDAAPPAAAAPEEPAPAKAEVAKEPGPAPTSPDAVFPVKDGEWPMWGGNPSRNMVNHREKGIASSWDVKTKKNIKWIAELGSQSYGNPVVAAGKVFIGTNNQAEKNPKVKGDRGIMMCVRASDGKFLWQAIHDKLESGRVNDWPEQGI